MSLKRCYFLLKRALLVGLSSQTSSLSELPAGVFWLEHGCGKQVAHAMALMVDLLALTDGRKSNSLCTTRGLR
jgi:hypothetical protein